jgi:DNA-binding response OmpR family regulator
VNELVLVVEDEPKITKLAKDYLENNGFRTLRQATVKLALRFSP